MAVSAYIFIECAQGQAVLASRRIAKIAGVKVADAVTGPYDIVARVEAEDVPSLGELVVTKVQKVPGVARTITSLVVG